MNIFLKSEYGKNKLLARDIMSNPVLFLAFGFGSGLAKKMPGTMGTLAAVPVYLAFIETNFWIYSLLTIMVTVTGVWICGDAAKRLGEHDYGGIVWDEVAGFLITLWWVPFSWHAVFFGFILFRIFDIVKPWPIKWIDQKVDGGLGIMLDDVLAGVLAAVVLAFIV